jgi:hypothetical protein
LIPFGQYRPDVSDFNGEHTKAILNVLPRGDGYGPMPSLEALTSALPAACRGYFLGRNADGSVAVFAGTLDELYKLNNTTLGWENVSKATYTDLSAGHHWQFTQFGLSIIAVQANTVPQLYTLGSSSDFADLGGSPPQAAYVSVVHRFLFLSGLTSTPRKIKWSGLGVITEWSAGTDQSGEQEFADGGDVRGISGGEYGIVLQESAIRHLTYVPNSTVIFDIERISSEDGMLAPYSLTKSGEKTYFYSRKGFRVIAPGSLPVSIGAERVDRTVAGDLDSANLHLMIGVADPASNRVHWTYKSQSGVADQFDKLLTYDYQLDRWAPSELLGQYIAPVAAPGTTLEGLDAIVPGALTITGTADSGTGEIRITVAPTATLTTGDIKAISGVGGTVEANGNWTITVVNGTTFDLDGSTFTNAWTSGGIVGGSLDDFTVSLDEISTAELPRLSVADPDSKIAIFSGTNLEATLETAEQGMSGQRFRVRGFRPVTDSATVHGSVSHRETLNATLEYSDEVQMNARGMCNANVSTRYARGKIRIPAETEWNLAAGLEPEFAQEGRR